MIAHKYLSVERFFLLFLCLFITKSVAQPITILKPDRVFDGEVMHSDWVVMIKGNKIEHAGPMTIKASKESIVYELKGMTLLPGLIEGHTHLFLHPYNEVSWENQVLNESRSERIIRATNHAKATLSAGFTTVRDLGTEGSMYDDIGLKESIEKGLIYGPKMIISTRAIVATGSYGPKLSPDNQNEIGAAVADGHDGLIKEIRTQIGKGADFIKLYADYRWGQNKLAQPTFTQEELNLAVDVTRSSGRKVVVHAVTPEGMRRSIIAGVATIEHGDLGSEEIFKLMNEKNIALCPTLSAAESILSYSGWKKGLEPDPQRILDKKKSFGIALKTGVTICMGGDVGVFAHGDNAKEMELMVEYGMNPVDVLKSATSINANIFGVGDKLGQIKRGFTADILVVLGDPSIEIKNIRNVKMVFKDGLLIKP